MGILGLTTYMDRNPGTYEDYGLHRENLVIDGTNLACHIYRWSGCNCCFGGDYDRYARIVDEFFHELLKCEVTPLVVFAGGVELKKLKTTLQRKTWKLKTLPSMMMSVFRTILRQRRIKMVRCVFGADSHIAGIAKVLDCPVLSNDSDFYIYGVRYIPTFTLERFSTKNSNGQGYTKRCKIYKMQNLLKSFPDLKASVLPLVAVLLGNDYVETSIFNSFYRSLTLSHRNEILSSAALIRIDTIFAWLRHYDVNDAITAILSKFSKKHRSKIIEIIELIIDSYVIMPFDMLIPLGFEKKFYRELELRKNEKPFKYEGNDEILQSRKLSIEEGTTEIVDVSSDDEEAENELETNESKLIDFEINTENEDFNEKIADTWPAWFHRCYSTAEFSGEFVDLMASRMYMFSIRIEDAKYPSDVTSWIEILRVIDGLLVAGREGAVPGFSYVTRERTRLVRRYIEKPLCGTRTTQFPPLSELRDTDMKIRKQIFDDTLEITDRAELFEDIPPEWRLYIAAISYWIKKSNEPPLNIRYMYATLLTMLFGIIDKKIGHHRSPEMFARHHRKTVEQIMWTRKNSWRKTVVVAPNSLVKAVQAVTKDDCWLAASFFVLNSRTTESFSKCSNGLDVTIVHFFQHFQSCLKNAMNLNTLLGYPYQQPIIAELYNGTMLYNFYQCFRKCVSIEAFIANVTNDSSSLVNVVGLLAIKMKSILEGTDIITELIETEGNKRTPG